MKTNLVASLQFCKVKKKKKNHPTYNVIALIVMRFFQDVGNLDESFFWKTLENRYAAKEKKPI